MRTNVNDNTHKREYSDIMNRSIHFLKRRIVQIVLQTRKIRQNGQNQAATEAFPV